MFQVTNLLLSVLSLLSLAAAHPYPNFHQTPHTSHAPFLTTRADTCPTSRLLSEDEYTFGYTTFCTNHIATPGSSGLVAESEPRTITLTLKDYDGNEIPWVFIVTSTDNIKQIDVMFNISHDLCMATFRRILEGASESDGDRKAVLGSGMAHSHERKWEDQVAVEGGGRLGSEFCIIQGSGGEGMSGEARTLVVGGSVVVKGVGTNGFSTVRFESRMRRGG